MIHINEKALRRREMKLITCSKGKERGLHDVGIIKHKRREILRNYEISKILVEIFVLVDNKTYIEFGKVRYRNYLVLLDDI